MIVANEAGYCGETKANQKRIPMPDTRRKFIKRSLPGNRPTGTRTDPVAAGVPSHRRLDSLDKIQISSAGARAMLCGAHSVAEAKTLLELEEQK